MLKQNDILDEWGGRTWKVLGVEGDAVYIELIAVPPWGDSDDIGKSNVILTNEVTI